MKRIILIIGVLFLLQSVSLGVETVGGWSDLWNNLSYRESNLESRNFKSAMLRMEGRFGVYAFDLWEGTKFMPYLAYVGVTAGDPSTWNNAVAYGAGFRLYPFAQNNLEWVKAIKFYAEGLSRSYLKNSASNPTSDARVGLDLWYEWNQAQQSEDAKAVSQSNLWGETWANVSYCQTNFEKTNFNSIIGRIEMKNGIYFGGGKAILFEPYLKTDLIMSGQRDFWLNNFVYGVGVRVQPFRSNESAAPWLYKLKIFLEALGVTYLNEKPTDGRPSTDFRFGLDLSLGR